MSKMVSVLSILIVIYDEGIIFQSHLRFYVKNARFFEIAVKFAFDYRFENNTNKQRKAVIITIENFCARFFAAVIAVRSSLIIISFFFFTLCLLAFLLLFFLLFNIMITFIKV